MLKQLRKRFMLAAIGAFAAVTVLLIAGINGANYARTAAAQDNLLSQIHNYDNISAQQPKKERPPINEMPWAEESVGAEFNLRFFTVHCSEDGTVHVFDRDYITSVDEETAEEYTQAVLAKGKDSGTYLEYRFAVYRSDDETEIVFLNVAESIRSGRRLLLVSAATGVIALLLVVVLVLVLSRYAMAPYVRNLKQQKQFITDAGHELKTPITAIAAGADILAMEYGQNEWTDDIKKQTARMTKLVGELVTLSRLDEEQPFPEREEFSLSDAVWELSESYEQLAQSKGKTYETDLQDGITMTGDRTTVQRLVSILLDNALRYSDEGGTIRLSLQQKQKKAVIEVYNTCVLPDDIDLDRLFDRFYRPDASRSTNTGGSGIGLSIARAAAERHGGQITVSSADGKSLLFRVVLPL